MKDLLTNVLLTLVIVYITVLIYSKIFNVELFHSKDAKQCEDVSTRSNDEIRLEPHYVPSEQAGIPMYSSANNVMITSANDDSSSHSSFPEGNETHLQQESEVKTKGHVRFDLDNIVKHGSDMTAESNGSDSEAVDVNSAWENVKHNQTKKEKNEELKIHEMLRNTLRDGVQVIEDNINPVSQKVKDAYTAPSASDIRSSSARSRDMMPEITSRKLDGNVDFAMTYMYKDRAPVTTIAEEAESVQWGATDAYYNAKKQWSQR